MTSNTLIRTLTLTFILFCFFALFVLASFSAKADLRPASDGIGMIELSGTALRPETQFEVLSVSADQAGPADNPTM